jgi:hypothetical protein
MTTAADINAGAVFIVAYLLAFPRCNISTGLAGVGIFFQQHPDSLDVFVRSMVRRFPH